MSNNSKEEDVESADSYSEEFDFPSHETLTELSGFQRDILFVISILDDPYGIEILEALEDLYETDISTGKLYPNLDDLDEMGIIEKTQRDKRTNIYRPTSLGRLARDAYVEFVTEASNNF